MKEIKVTDTEGLKNLSGVITNPQKPNEFIKSVFKAKGGKQ